MNDRLVLNDLNARNELEVIDSLYDRTIITTNSANILNIMTESSPVSPEEEVIRKRGRKKTPKISMLPLRRSPRKAPKRPTSPLRRSPRKVPKIPMSPLRRSPRKAPNPSSDTTSHSDRTHSLSTPKKKPQKSPPVVRPAIRTPYFYRLKVIQYPSH